LEDVRIDLDGEVAAIAQRDQAQHLLMGGLRDGDEDLIDVAGVDEVGQILRHPDHRDPGHVGDAVGAGGDHADHLIAEPRRGLDAADHHLGGLAGPHDQHAAAIPSPRPQPSPQTPHHQPPDPHPDDAQPPGVEDHGPGIIEGEQSVLEGHRGGGDGEDRGQGESRRRPRDLVQP